MHATASEREEREMQLRKYPSEESEEANARRRSAGKEQLVCTYRESERRRRKNRSDTRKTGERDTKKTNRRTQERARRPIRAEEV